MLTERRGSFTARDQQFLSITSEITAQNVILSAYNVQLNLKFDASEPRVPAGNSDGGQWTSSGSGASHILNSPMLHNGKSYRNSKGNTECVTFAQQAGGASLTKNWKQGPSISPAKPPAVGTWVATFVNGHYYGHVGVLMGYDPDGTLLLLDQYNKKGKVSITRIHHKSQSFHGRISNDPSKYHIVLW